MYVHCERNFRQQMMRVGSDFIVDFYKNNTYEIFNYKSVITPIYFN